MTQGAFAKGPIFQPTTNCEPLFNSAVDFRCSWPFYALSPRQKPSISFTN